MQRDAADVLGLGLKVRAAELLAVQQPELAGRHLGRVDDHQRGGVARVRRVISDPYRLPCERALRKGLKVAGPDFPRIHHAPLHHLQGER
ncbi:hypothetical protein D3C86_1949230 [compost metagenome]